MIIGITAIVLTFIYFLIVSIIYFKKNRVKNLDNRVFSILCILNLIGLLLELSCYYLVVNREKYLVLNEVVNRLFLIYIICWSFTLIEYGILFWFSFT